MGTLQAVLFIISLSCWWAAVGSVGYACGLWLSPSRYQGMQPVSLAVMLAAGPLTLPYVIIGAVYNKIQQEREA